MMNIKDYCNGFMDYIDNLSDEQFIEELGKAGLNEYFSNQQNEQEYIISNIEEKPKKEYKANKCINMEQFILVENNKKTKKIKSKNNKKGVNYNSDNPKFNFLKYEVA